MNNYTDLTHIFDEEIQNTYAGPRAKEIVKERLKSLIKSGIESKLKK